MNDLDPKNDTELEALLGELSPEERDALLEEHRQLEKDLLRLADPLPPSDFVHKVMAKVAAAPAPAPAPRDIALAAFITLSAFAAGVISFASHGAGIGGIGLSFNDLFLHVSNLVTAFGTTLGAVWHTAAVPVAAALAATLVTSVVALKKIGTEAKVVS